MHIERILGALKYVNLNHYLGCFVMKRSAIFQHRLSRITSFRSFFPTLFWGTTHVAGARLQKRATVSRPIAGPDIRRRRLDTLYVQSGTHFDPRSRATLGLVGTWRDDPRVYAGCCWKVFPHIVSWVREGHGIQHVKGYNGTPWH